MNPNIEVVRRVYVEGERGVYVEVAPWSEVSGFVVLEAPGEKNKEWFGDRLFGTSMKPEFARALGEALIAAAEEAEVQQ